MRPERAADTDVDAVPAEPGSAAGVGAPSVAPVLSGRIGLSPVMVGRARAFARLAGIVDAADVMTGDQAAVALVSGEAGIGKTRLVRELVQSLPGADHDARRDRPAGVDGPSPRRRRRAGRARPGRRRRSATAVFDIVADGHRPGAGASSSSRTSTGSTRRAPTSIDRIAQQPWPNLVIIATYRPNDLSRGQPGGELVLRLERRHSVEQVRLERLDRTEVDAMVAAITAASGAQPSSAFVEALHRRSGGIPFVVEELMRVVGPRAMRRPTCSTPSCRGRWRRPCASSSRGSTTAGAGSSRRWPCTGGRRRSRRC